MDHAAPVLSSEPSLDPQAKSDLWDAFHSKSPEELIQHLTPLAVPDDFKKRLLDAKQASLPPVKAEPVDKVSAAIGKMVTLPPDVLDKAENHPNVLKAFTTAATTAEPAAQEPAGAASPAGKSKKAAGTPEAASVAPDLPPTPSGHALTHSSNGGYYHVPVANIAKAKAIDPSLTVLHVEP
jgi:hypothetical protein